MTTLLFVRGIYVIIPVKVRTPGLFADYVREMRPRRLAAGRLQDEEVLGMGFINYLINGISLGSVYAIIALGYTMVYGIAKMLNFAHGDVIMIGSFVVFVTVSSMGFPTLLGILLAVIVCTVLGVVIERVAYKPLRDAGAYKSLVWETSPNPFNTDSSVATHRSDADGARSFTTVLFLFAGISLCEVPQFFIVGRVNGKVPQLLTGFFQLGIRSFLFGKLLGKFHLKALDRGQLLHAQFVESLLCCLVYDDVRLMLGQKLF